MTFKLIDSIPIFSQASVESNQEEYEKSGLTIYYLHILQLNIPLFYFYGYSNDRLKSFRERKQRRIKLENEVCSEIFTYVFTGYDYQ